MKALKHGNALGAITFLVKQFEDVFLTHPAKFIVKASPGSCQFSSPIQ
jgi:hypothetical protein